MRVLIVDLMHESLFPMLDDLGVHYDYIPDISATEIAHKLEGYETLIIRSKVFVDQQLLAKANNLKFILRAGAGIDNLDAEALKNKGITIINAPEGNRNAVAEHTLGLVFGMLNNIPQSNNQVKAKIWDREGNRGHELMGKTVGIIGYGFMGEATANKFIHLGCKVLVYDKYKQGFGNSLIIETTLEDIFEQADIVSLHVPLTSETKFMVNDAFLGQFKKAIWLTNTSRGEVVKNSAIIRALQINILRGVALDVLENEKFNTFTDLQKSEFEELRNHDRVILTPHVAGWTFESYQRINEVLVQKLKAAMAIEN